MMRRPAVILGKVGLLVDARFTHRGCILSLMVFLGKIDDVVSSISARECVSRHVISDQFYFISCTIECGKF